MTQLTSKTLRDELHNFAEGTLQVRLEAVIAGLRNDVKEVKHMIHDLRAPATIPEGEWSLRANGHATKTEVPSPPVSNIRKTPPLTFAEAEHPALSCQKVVDLDEDPVPETVLSEHVRHSPPTEHARFSPRMTPGSSTTTRRKPSVRSHGPVMRNSKSSLSHTTHGTRRSRTRSSHSLVSVGNSVINNNIEEEDPGDVIHLNPNLENYLNEDDAKILRKYKDGGTLNPDGEPTPMKPRRIFTTKFEKSMTWTTREWFACICCCEWIANIVLSKPFEYGVMFMVLANAIIIGFETEHNASAQTAESALGFRICETCFCVLFTTELVLRMSVLGCDFFRMKGWEWNWADCVVVVLQIVEELTIIFAGYTEASGGGVLNFSFVRILRILRLVRVVRIMRVLRYMGELRTLIFSISSSLKPLAWTIVLIMMMIYICAIYFTQLVTDHFHSNPGEPPHAELKHYFGSLGASFLALFECITGGVDWDTVLDPLRHEISPFLTPVFCLYIAFSVLAMLNTITGVFVESSIRSARDQTDNFMLNTVREAFLAAGGSITGVMTAEGLETQLNTPHMKAYFKSIDVDTSQARGLFLLLDRDGSGEIDFEEFLSGCLRLRGPTKALDLHILTHEVRMFAARFRSFSTIMEARLGVSEQDDMSPMEIRSGSKELSLDSVVRSLEGPPEFFKRISDASANPSTFKKDTPIQCLPTLGANMPNVPFEPAPPLQVEPME